MILVQVTDARLVLGAHTIFENLQWSIKDGEKIGLIGPNGAGKSSLFKVIVGEYNLEPGGQVVFARGVTVGYLQQEPLLPRDTSALDIALQGRARWAELRHLLDQVEKSMGDPEIFGDERKLSHAIDRQQNLHQEYLSLGGDGYPGQVQQILTGLGLEEEDQHKPAHALSGGQKKLVWLARLLLQQPDVLLLDEPDNHLDLKGKAYLEGLISNYPGAVVLVSHDRYLLDATVTHIAELEDGIITVSAGDYTTFMLDKEARLLRSEQIFQLQQREINRLEQAYKRYALWTQKNSKFASRMHAMEKRLERMDKMDRPVLERRKVGLELNGWRGSKKVLEMRHVSKSYDREPVLMDINGVITHGERVGIIGPNGSGKSVLLRMILGHEGSDEGEIIVGPSIMMGYYAQQHETLDLGLSILDTVRLGLPDGRTMSEGQAVAFLGRYLFPYEKVRLPVKELSGGERSRLQLALLVLSGANFLLLDEPTNNIDIATAEVLEQALEEFEGTVLLVSHDRYFLDRVATRLWALEDGEKREFAGGYSDYLQKLELETGQAY